MAVTVIRYGFHLFPNYQIVCDHCALLLNVESAKDITIIPGLEDGVEVIRLPAVTCPLCGKTTLFPNRDRALALSAYNLLRYM